MTSIVGNSRGPLRAPVFADREAQFVAPEDVILKKMEYYREGGSEKHLRDIAGVATVLGQKLDRKYIEAMSLRMGLEEIWRALEARLRA